VEEEEVIHIAGLAGQRQRESESRRERAGERQRESERERGGCIMLLSCSDGLLPGKPHII